MTFYCMAGTKTWDERHGMYSKLTNAHKLVRFKGISCHETQKPVILFLQCNETYKLKTNIET